MKFVIKFLLFCLFALHVKAETVLSFQAGINPHAKYLGDILLITPDTHHWSKIILDSQPKNGDLVNQSQVIHWLQNKVGLFKYQWQGRKTAIIRQEAQSKSRDLLNKAKNALEHQLKKQGYSDVTLSSTSSIKDSDIPLADFTVQLPQNYPTAKRVCVRLHYKKKSIPVWFTVKAYQSVLVMQHPMKYHRLIQSSDVFLEKRNIAGLHIQPFTQLPSGLWLTKSINKNQILTPDYLSNKPQVLQGQKITVQVHQQGISLITEALAQSTGYTGQSIRMKNVHTNRYFVARITGENQAEIAA